MLDYSAFIRERTANFTGRTWVFAKIAEWLGDPGGARCFLLTGEPGSGKTAVSARLCEFSDGITAPPDGLPSLSPGFLSAFHFCTARDRYWLDPHAFAESLARQLAARYPDTFAVALAEKSSDRQIVIHVEQSVT